MPQVGVKGTFPLITFANADQIVSVSQIQLAKNGYSLKEFEGGGEKGQRVFVLDGDFIQQCFVLFFSTKKNPAETGEEEARMMPAKGDSEMYFSIASRSGRERI